MPRSVEHRSKADRNRNFLQTVDVLAFPEWATIAAFYLAMHLVERLSACENIHHSTHQDRLSYVNKHKQHRCIRTNFSHLYDASLIARYDTFQRFQKAFPGDTVKVRLIDIDLVAIEEYVSRHFAASGA